MSSSLVDQDRRMRLAGKLQPSVVCMSEILLVLSMVLSISNLSLSGSTSGLFDSLLGSKLRFVLAIKLPRGLL